MQMHQGNHHIRPAVPSAFIPLLVLGLAMVSAAARAGGVLDLEPEGPIAAREDQLIAITLGLMLIVLIPVFAMTLIFAWHYRAGNTRATYMPKWSAARSGSCSISIGTCFCRRS